MFCTVVKRHVLVFKEKHIFVKLQIFLPKKFRNPVLKTMATIINHSQNKFICKLSGLFRVFTNYEHFDLKIVYSDNSLHT